MTGADALLARAIALEDAGRPEEALGQYRALLAGEPLHADARHNHGLLLARLGRFAEAESSHREYVERHPHDARAYGDLADVLIALERYDEALAALDRVLLLEPDHASALVRRGVALSCLRRFDEARRVFREALERHAQETARFLSRITPGAPLETALSPENIFFTRRYMAQGACDWRDWDAYVAQMRRAAADPAVMLEPAIGFMAQHLALDDAERHAIMRRIAAPIEARLPALPPPPVRSRQRIRIGVLSPDLHEHLNAYLLRPLFELADRGRFELYAYSLGPDDGSTARGRIRTAADCFRDLRPQSDAQAAQLIRGDDIDILLDVGGFTTNARFGITAQRPARVQVSYLGFPSSLGSRRVDYAIVDAVAAPEGDSWSELLVHLPHTFFLYDYRDELPTTAVSRADYGLPQDAFVFCAFHKAEKITPESFQPWVEVLLRVPRSVLWISGVRGAATDNLRREAQARGVLGAATDNLRREAHARGVDPARLVFAPFESRDRYLARHRLGDLMLDAFNHNALTTACDALGMGLPLLTCGGGKSFASRAAESIVRAAGMPDLVAADRDAYVSTAVGLASDRAALRDTKDRLARNRGSAPLFDTAGRVRELEAALQSML